MYFVNPIINTERMVVKMVMIVDDDADDRELFCEALYEVDTSIQCIACASGMEALELLKSSQHIVPNYIFLDLNMPRMNGRQCLQELKQMETFKQMDVIIYSTSKITADVKETKMQGAVHFITKPCSFNDLRTIIRTVLSNNWAKLNND
jgi:CheY-like chemotaxis protein